MGVRSFLEELENNNLVCGLMSGNLEQIGRKKMELAGLSRFFSVAGFSQDGRSRKEIARVAAERARAKGLINGDCRITLIGDHQNDIEAAKANGFQSVAVATGLMSCEELREFSPDILVRNLTELDIRKLVHRTSSYL